MSAPKFRYGWRVHLWLAGIYVYTFARLALPPALLLGSIYFLVTR